MRITPNPTATVLPDPTTEPTVSVERAGAILNVSRHNAYAGVRDGTIPSIRIGHRIVVPTPALLKMLGIEYRATGDAA